MRGNYFRRMNLISNFHDGFVEWARIFNQGLRSVFLSLGGNHAFFNTLCLAVQGVVAVAGSKMCNGPGQCIFSVVEIVLLHLGAVAVHGLLSDLDRRQRLPLRESDAAGGPEVPHFSEMPSAMFVKLNNWDWSVTMLQHHAQSRSRPLAIMRAAHTINIYNYFN
ncbi:MAG TPA: hypothetical protein VGC14_19000 [Rhizobium sp.]